MSAWTWKACGVTGIQKGIGPKGQTAYRVRWFEGGRRKNPDGSKAKEPTRTFDYLTQARAFRGRLVANDYRDPDATTAIPVQRGSSDDVEPVAPAATVPTLRQAVAFYFATREQSGRTSGEYLSKLELHVFPTIVRAASGKYTMPLGDMPVDQVAQLDVMLAWLEQMKTKTYQPCPKKNPELIKFYSPKTITEIVCSVLSPTFEYALNPRRGWITSNPCHDEEFKLPERK